MQIKIVILLAASIAISSANAAQKKPTPIQQPTAADLQAQAQRKMIENAQSIITERLKDPKSARFRAVFTSPKMLAVCGEVNAKNSMGGYVGFRRFIVAQDKIGTEEDGSYFVESNWVGRCKNDEIY